MVEREWTKKMKIQIKQSSMHLEERMSTPETDPTKPKDTTERKMVDKKSRTISGDDTAWSSINTAKFKKAQNKFSAAEEENWGNSLRQGRHHRTITVPTFEGILGTDIENLALT